MELMSNSQFPLLLFKWVNPVSVLLKSRPLIGWNAVSELAAAGYSPDQLLYNPHFGNLFGQSVGELLSGWVDIEPRAEAVLGQTII